PSLPTWATDCGRGFLPAAVAQVPPSSLSSPHFTTVQSSRTKSDALTAAPLPADTVLTTVFSVGSVSLGSEISGFWPNFPSTWATPSAESLFLSSSAPHAAVNSRAGTASSAARRRYVLWFISPTGSRGRGGDARHSTTCDPVDHENAVTPRRKNAPGTRDAPRVSPPGGIATGRRGRPDRPHAGDQLHPPLVHRAEGVLAQHGPLRLVDELEGDPVDGEVPALLLGPPDEVAAQPRPGGLRRHRLALEDLEVVADPGGLPPLLEQVVQTTTPVDVVVGEVYLRDPRIRHGHVVLGPVPLDELVLHDPVDLGADAVEVLLLDGVQGAAPQLQHLLHRAGADAPAL